MAEQTNGKSVEKRLCLYLCSSVTVGRSLHCVRFCDPSKWHSYM